MVSFIYFLLLLILFLVPFVVIYFHQHINLRLSQADLPFKTPDVLNIYLIVAIHFFSRIAFGTTWLTSFTLIISLIGLGMVAYLLYKKKTIVYTRFFKVWWRIVFLVAFVFYLISAIAALVGVLI